MAVRVRDYSRAHPSADASYASVLSRLESRITRMEELAGQQQGGFLSKHSSTRAAEGAPAAAARWAAPPPGDDRARRGAARTRR